MFSKIASFFAKEEHCQCTKHHSDYCDTIEKLMKMSLKTKKFNEESSKKMYSELTKVDEKILNISSENLKQILKDLNRTYPSYNLFRNDKTQQKLENVLRAFSKNYKEICYFQGMNFVVGFFLYHCEEYVAYWLFVSLFDDDTELAELFSPGFPGLKFHVEKVREIVKYKMPEVDDLFNKLNVNIEIIMIEWLYSLFSSTIPLDSQADFYFGFFNQKWIFFYKMCLSCFMELDGTFTSAADVYIALKFENFKKQNLNEQNKIWKGIINRAYKIDINYDIQKNNSNENYNKDNKKE